MKQIQRNVQNVFFALLIFILLIYVGLKAFLSGNDINVYLYASKQLFDGENIYSGNIFNDYYYSPLFAILMRPLSILNYESARILWAFINLLAVFRLGQIFYRIIKKELNFDKKMMQYWTVLIIFLSLGFLNYILILGQITIVILWLTAEGLFQILKNNKFIIGSLLLALGINIKILPALVLFYLFFKRKYKVVFLILGFLFLSLYLPVPVIGYRYNNELLHHWKQRLNPTDERFVLENNNASNSVSAIMSAYFYDFKSVNDKEIYHFKRKITFISYSNLVIIVQIIRVLLVLSVLFLIFYKYKHRKNKLLYFYREFAWLMLTTLLIFPHQVNYSLLYFSPAASYISLILLISVRRKFLLKLKYKIVVVASSIMMIVLALSGRDIVGNKTAEILGFYHVPGLIIISFLFFLLLVKPDEVLQLNKVTDKV